MHKVLWSLSMVSFFLKLLVTIKCFTKAIQEDSFLTKTTQQWVDANWSVISSMQQTHNSQWHYLTSFFYLFTTVYDFCQIWFLEVSEREITRFHVFSHLREYPAPQWRLTTKLDVLISSIQVGAFVQVILVLPCIFLSQKVPICVPLIFVVL